MLCSLKFYVEDDNNLLFLVLEICVVQFPFSCRKYLLSGQCAPGTVLGTKDIALNKTDKNLCLHPSWKKQTICKIIVSYTICYKVVSAIEKIK